jgi:RNA polymerase sigma-70 factor (ECF subfamily)
VVDNRPHLATRAEDAALLAAHLAGDRDAFNELVARHRDQLWAVAVRTLGDREEAADAVQEAFLAAFRGASAFRGDAAVSTWLHRITVNACLDRMRRARVRPTVPLPDPATGGAEPADPVDAYAISELSLDVTAALRQLPTDQRVALLLVDVHDMSIAEAAQVLSVPEGTVKSRCARGRIRLAGLLTPAPGNRDAAAYVEKTKMSTSATEPGPSAGPAGKGAR